MIAISPKNGRTRKMRTGEKMSVLDRDRTRVSFVIQVYCASTSGFEGDDIFRLATVGSHRKSG